MGQNRKAMSSAVGFFGLASLLTSSNNIVGAMTTTVNELDMFNPGTVVLGNAFAVEWTSIGENRFDIELFEGDDCSGDQVLDLCGKDTGCGDTQGDHNVVIPDSVNEGQYSIRVSVHDQPTVYGCTEGFTVSATAPNGLEGSSLTAYAPEDTVSTGIEFTAEWDYDDGTGVTESRFYIDLYEEGCTGSMIEALCDKPERGCLDSAGDYPVTISKAVAAGTYSLKIGVFGTQTPVGCSPGFAVQESTVGATIDFADVDTPWPEYQFAKEPCDPNVEFQLRYAASTERVYYEHTDNKTGGCATLTQLLELRSETNGTVKGPLYPLDPETGEKLMNASQVTGHWLIESDIYVRNGVTLQLYGTADGGDCDALRILSPDGKAYNLRGHGGNLDILGTVITSWDANTKAPKEVDQIGEDDDTEPRSYISCLSEIITDSDETCAGRALFTRGECRMDIVRSEIAYLGYYGSEAYGLTWKVRGFCSTKTNPEVFDSVNTYGNLIDSNVHHLFYGLYTYGHLGGLWINNEMHDNEWYGFDPHDDSDYLTIHNNKVYNNGKHGIIASKRCNHVSIQNNEVYNGGEYAAGIFLHRSSDHAIVKGNHMYNMQDSGLAALESSDITFENNLVEQCKYGVRLSLGSSANTVTNNTFSGLTSYGIFTYVGSNEPDVEGNIYRPYDNVFSGNIIKAAAVIKLKEADTSVITGNTIQDSVLCEFDNSQKTIFTDNTYDASTTITVKNGACFDEEDAGLNAACD